MMWENHHEVGYWGGIELCGAIRNRHFQVVEWLQTHVSIQLECTRYIVNKAAAHGNLEIVKWLYESFDVALDDAVKKAALNCEWKVVRWILDMASDLMWIPHFVVTLSIQVHQRAATWKFLSSSLIVALRNILSLSSEKRLQEVTCTLSSGCTKRRGLQMLALDSSTLPEWVIWRC
uniref:Uncharacterized protein n=1 Tax=Hyaloperonospora arabidopsidis (strain Emoy2) TaxID=559515 RepID=M4BCG1_HYAAE